MPFERTLMVRTNVSGGEIQLGNQYVRPYRIKANKKIKTVPMQYAITIDKKGYQPYRDTVDLTKPASYCSAFVKISCRRRPNRRRRVKKDSSSAPPGSAARSTPYSGCSCG